MRAKALIKAGVLVRAAPRFPSDLGRRSRRHTDECRSPIPRGPSSAAGRARRGHDEAQEGKTVRLAATYSPTFISCVRPSEHPKLIDSPIRRSVGRTCGRHWVDWGS